MICSCDHVGDLTSGSGPEQPMAVLRWRGTSVSEVPRIAFMGSLSLVAVAEGMAATGAGGEGSRS
jgi:hypothetical protein